MRTEIKQLYQDACQKGLYFEARRLLDLLNNKRVNLGIDDVNWYVSRKLEEIGLRVSQVTRQAEYIFQI